MPIVDAPEWQKPTWRYQGFDSVDFGLEWELTGGRVFSVTWDPPGMREGVGIREEPLLGSGVRTDAAVAVRDVGRRGRWAQVFGVEITDLVAHYLPWDEQAGSSWCPRITMRFGVARVELMLGQAGADQRLAPAADNIAVLFDPTSYPRSMRR